MRTGRTLHPCSIPGKKQRLIRKKGAGKNDVEMVLDESTKKWGLEPWPPVVREALPAVDRPALGRLERYFALFTTV
jgi:hypothetical protein